MDSQTDVQGCLVFETVYQAVLSSACISCGVCTGVYSVYALAEYPSAQQTAAACGTGRACCRARSDYRVYAFV